MSDGMSLLKAWATLQSFRQNVPHGDIEESYVIEYHKIIRTLEQLTGNQLQEFLVADTVLRHPPGTLNYKDERTFPRSRYCEREMFLMKLDASIIFFTYLTPDEGRRQIGF